MSADGNGGLPARFSSSNSLASSTAVQVHLPSGRTLVVQCAPNERFRELQDKIQEQHRSKPGTYYKISKDATAMNPEEFVLSHGTTFSATVMMDETLREPTQRFSALQQQLLCAAIHFFHRHIRSDPDVVQRMEGNEMFKLFYEVQYHQNKPDLNRIFPESVHDCSALHVCSFILSILHQGIFSVSAFIVSVIYLSRFKESSHITLHACTWRPLFLTSLLLADKMWEDKPVRNSSLAKLFPVLSNSELNKMESEFLVEVRFNVLVKPDLFCSFCEKLLAETVHQEITRCVNNSDYAATLQADHVEANVPMKSSKLQEVPKVQESGPGYGSAEKVSHNRPKALSADKMEVTRHTIGGPEEYAQNEARFDPVPRTSGRQGQGQVAQWLETNGPSSTGSSMGPVVPPTVTSSASGPPGDGVVPRSQSAGPTTGIGSRRGDPSRMPPQSQQLLMSLRGSNASAIASNNLNIAGGSHSQVARGGVDSSGSQAGSQSAKTMTTPHPPRSVSVHPLHRTESQKKHAMGKAEDQPPEKTVPPGRAGQTAYSGPPLRRSLPAKTSGGYAPLSRAPSGGGSTHSGIARDMANISGGGSTHGGGPGSGGSGPGSANTTASVSRQPPQNSPRSPGSVSPVVMGHDNQVGHQAFGGRPNQAQQEGSAHTPNSTHGQGQSGRSNSHPRVTSAPAGPGRYTIGHPTGSMSSASRVATPPVPLSSGHLASHSGPPGQVGSTLKAQQSSRGASPGSLAGMGNHHQNSVSGGQPTRASSAPRVSGLTGHGHHHNHATPPGSSSVRTAASQPVGQGGSSGQSRVPGHHVPGSPSLNSPMAVPPPHSFGGSSGGTGASVVVFPASPTTRGNSPPAPALNMVGSSMPMKTNRGTIGSSGGLQRNASPMGIGAPASPAGTMSPAGNLPLGSMNISGNRPDPLSTTRGRSPPPGIAGNNAAPTARAPRAVTPGQIVKSIQQGTSGNIPRSSFGGAQMVMHRGM